MRTSESTAGGPRPVHPVRAGPALYVASPDAPLEDARVVEGAQPHDAVRRAVLEAIGEEPDEEAAG